MNSGRMEGEYEEERYRISFEHGMSQAMHRMSTLARVEVSTASGGWEHYLTGRSWCNHCDEFRRETGRKLALTRALANEPREFRAFMWKVYLGRKGAHVQKETISGGFI